MNFRDHQTPEHLPPCDGSCTKDRGWECGICKRQCAPCWGGHYDDNLGDVCEPCTNLQQPNRYRIITINGNPQMAAIEVMRKHPGWIAIAAAQTAIGQSAVAIIHEEEIIAAIGARIECNQDGHKPGHIGREKLQRCLRCGIRIEPQ